MNTKSFLILFVFIASLVACKKNEVIINGKVIGNSIARVEYTAPVNGVFKGVVADTISPDSLGNFKLVISLKNPGFIVFRPYYNSNPVYKIQGSLIAEPGNSYNLTIDPANEKEPFLVSGKNAVAINQYNNLPYAIFFLMNNSQVFMPFARDSVATSISEKISAEREKEITLFRELEEKGEISDEILKLIANDRRCYYDALASTIISVKYSNSILLEGRKLPPAQALIMKYTDDMKAIWEKAVSRAESDQAEIAASPYWNYYYQNYIYFKLYFGNELSPAKRSELYKAESFSTFFVNEGAKKYLPQPLFEAFFANFIFYECLVYENETYEIVTLYNQFVTEYPNSIYTKYLTPYIDKINDFHKKIAAPELSENVKYVENYENLNTLKDCLALFKGKKLYIDLWASWCGSCRLEFSKKAELDSLLASKGIEILYLSMDEDKYEKNWKDLIKYYNLEGYHVRANKSLSADMIRLQNAGNESYYVPWHIMFDEAGNKVDLPSEIEELLK